MSPKMRTFGISFLSVCKCI